MIQTTQLNFSYAADTAPPSEHLPVLLYGDSVVRLIKTETLSCIKVQFQAFIIQNDKTSETDVKLEIRDRFLSRIPMEIAYIRKNDAVFIVFISPTAQMHSLPDDLPQQILNENLFK